MSALSIQPTFPIFTETDGQPLENGYIWIGTVNLDPQVNPVNVYFDAALTVQAAQPIRTINGYPSRNGTPARLYVNSDYSIRVMNRNGSTVYSAPASTERYSDVVIDAIDASTVKYTSPLSNAIQVTAQDIFEQTVSVMEFGAVGDGITNDTTAIMNALASVDKGNLYFPAGTYKCNIVVGNNTRIIGAGRQKTFFIAQDTTQPIILFNETSSSTYYFIGGQDFSVNGNFTAEVGIQIGSTTGTVTYGSLDRVEVYRCDDNVICKNTVVFDIDELYSWQAANAAFKINDDDPSSDVVTCLRMTNSEFRLSSTGLSLRSGALMSFANCIIEANKRYGLDLYRGTAVGARGVRFDSCWFEGNGTDGVGTYSDASSIFINMSVGVLPASGEYYPLETQFVNCQIGSNINAYDVYLLRASDGVLFDHCVFNDTPGALVSGENPSPAVNKLYYDQLGGGTGFAFATIRQCSTTYSRPNPTLYSNLPLIPTLDGTKLFGYQYEFEYEGYKYTNSKPFAFLATLDVGANIANVTGNGAEYSTTNLFPVATSVIEYNYGGLFDSTTGEFTATSPGLYEFSVSWPITNFSSAMNAANVKIYKNANPFVVSYTKISSYGAADLETYNGSITLELDAGDVVASSITLTGGAGNTASLYRGASVFFFSGKQI